MLIGVIPSAGLGTRLGENTPKLFVQITLTAKVIDLLEDVICDVVDECCFIIRPDMITSFENFSTNPKSTYITQAKPHGMGDAVFKAASKFVNYDDVLVVWGDQVSLNRETLNQVIKSHFEKDSFCTIPLVKLHNPYVHYEIDDAKGLKEILQAREGDLLPKIGYSDIGVFLLKSRNLDVEWNRFLKESRKLGNVTNEINFLPFLLFLAQSGKKMNFLHVNDPFESIGMNTQDDLKKLRSTIEKRGQ